MRSAPDSAAMASSGSDAIVSCRNAFLRGKPASITARPSRRQHDIRDAVVARIDTARDPAERFERLQLPRERARIDAQPLDELLLRRFPRLLVQREQDAPARHRLADLRFER